jgi:hypothetical protein
MVYLLCFRIKQIQCTNEILNKFSLYIFPRYIFRQIPNVVVECLTLLLRIPEVPGSNLGPAYRLC